MKRSICLSLCLCATVVNGYAQEWHNGESSVVLANLSPEQARAEALRNAEANALEQAGTEVVGVTSRHLAETSGTENFDVFARFSRSITRGRIVEKEILFDDQEKIAGQWRYRVALRARVEMNVGQPDPTFTVDLSLNERFYKNGEILVATITATQDCFITLFNLYANDSLSVLLPNIFSEQQGLSRMIRKGVPLVFPPPGKGWELYLGLTPGSESLTEALMVVATKDDIPFATAGAGMTGDLIASQDALTTISRWLVDIPADRRTENLAHYTIVKWDKRKSPKH